MNDDKCDQVLTLLFGITQRMQELAENQKTIVTAYNEQHQTNINNGRILQEWFDRFDTELQQQRLDLNNVSLTLETAIRTTEALELEEGGGGSLLDGLRDIFADPLVNPLQNIDDFVRDPFGENTIARIAQLISEQLGSNPTGTLNSGNTDDITNGANTLTVDSIISALRAELNALAPNEDKEDCVSLEELTTKVQEINQRIFDEIHGPEGAVIKLALGQATQRELIINAVQECKRELKKELLEELSEEITEQLFKKFIADTFVNGVSLAAILAAIAAAVGVGTATDVGLGLFDIAGRVYDLINDFLENVEALNADAPLSKEDIELLLAQHRQTFWEERLFHPLNLIGINIESEGRKTREDILEIKEPIVNSWNALQRIEPDISFLVEQFPLEFPECDLSEVLLRLQIAQASINLIPLNDATRILNRLQGLELDYFAPINNKTTQILNNFPIDLDLSEVIALINKIPLNTAERILNRLTSYEFDYFEPVNRKTTEILNYLPVDLSSILNSLNDIPINDADRILNRLTGLEISHWDPALERLNEIKNEFINVDGETIIHAWSFSEDDEEVSWQGNAFDGLSKGQQVLANQIKAISAALTQDVSLLYDGASHKEVEDEVHVSLPVSTNLISTFPISLSSGRLIDQVEGKFLPVVLEILGSGLRQRFESMRLLQAPLVIPQGQIHEHLEATIPFLQLEWTSVSKYPNWDKAVGTSNIPDPIDNLDWETHFENLFYERGKFFGSVLWTNKGIRTGAKFKNTDEANRVLDIFESLSKREPNRELGDNGRRITQSSEYFGEVRVFRAIVAQKQEDGSLKILKCFQAPKV